MGGITENNLESFTVYLQWVLRGNRTAALHSIIGFGINGGFKNSEHMLLLELEEKIIT